MAYRGLVTYLLTLPDPPSRDPRDMVFAKPSWTMGSGFMDRRDMAFG